MNTIQVDRSISSARPMLLNIISISNTLPKTNYAVYYKNYTSPDPNSFKNINQLTQLFLPHHQLTFKIVNIVQSSLPIYIDSSGFGINGKSVTIEANYKGDRIELIGTIINQSASQAGQAVVDLSMVAKEGYDDFYKFRKKYKTLENITKSLEFKIDHRIKLKTATKQYKFDLQQRKKEHYYLNLQAFEHPLHFQLEEITSIQDYTNADAIAESQVLLSEILHLDYGYTLKIKYSNMFQVTFLFDLVINQNLSESELVSIRLLETSEACQQVKIGHQNNINLDSCLKVAPLVGKKYFDYEWGYLNENLNKIGGNNQVFDHLDKITQSTEVYQGFVNQEILDLKDATQLVFNLDGQILSVPIIYILRGINHIENAKTSLKFYIDSLHKQSSKYLLDPKSDHRRTYELKVHSLINMVKINPILDRKGTNQFYLKIINQSTIYQIPFSRTIFPKNQFRKEAKQLTTKQQLHLNDKNKQAWIMFSSKSKEEVIVIQSYDILPFYLIEWISSASVSFQIVVRNSIQLQGSLFKQKVVDNQGKHFMHLLGALEGEARIGISLSLQEVKQVNQSAATLYNFRHRLYFAEAAETEEVAYDVEVDFQKGSKLKPLRSKLTPELKRQSTSEGIFLREFNNNSSILVKQGRLSFTVTLRKMFYSEQLNYFDNQVLISKAIVINPSAQTIKQNKSLMIRLDNECYQGIEIDLYDTNIKKRMKYYLEIYAQKNEFLDHRDSSYKIKIPPILWNFINPKSQKTNRSYEITTHLNRKRKNIDSSAFSDNFQQQIVLDHYNYNDGVSLVEKGTADISYSKMLRCLKLRCDIVSNKLGWSPQSDWYFAVLNLSQSNFYFMVQRLFDPYENKQKSSSSNKSRRTVSRELSHRSDKHKIDPLAKTISNLDLYKLKQKKNEIIAEGRLLTTRYVKRQEKIIELTKKIEEIEEKTRQKEKQQLQTTTNKRQIKKQNVKMKEFYRSICECGDKFPQFNGYCQICLKRLKQRYEAYFKEYKQSCYAYETMMFQQFNQKQKIQRMKRRVQGLKNQEMVVEGEDGSTGELLMRNLEEKSLKKHIQDLRVQLFELEQQKSSLLQKSNWQMKILQKKISDQDGEIYKLSQQYDSLKKQLVDLTNLIKNDQQNLQK